VTYTIGETARRSGFSTSALRYYEGIGLVEPTARTTSGYRVYDNQALARLAFIARAKQLGCSLEEVTDLIGLWDGERCGPVQRRFHDLLTTKIADAQRRIDELGVLVAQLQQAAAHLDGPAVDGPCSATCACMGSVPIYDATEPVSCTASRGEVPVRIEQIERMRTRLARLERSPHGLILHFHDEPAVRAELERFASDEKACCAFWGFAVTADDGDLALRWDGPPEVDDVFDRLVEFFESDRPLTAIDGLL
jgi:MerR family transcriptional regulator, copper efflux regulator